MKKLIVVADWVDDSLTRQEIISALDGFLKDPDDMNVTFVSSTPSTIHTSFLISQIVENEERYGRPLETVLFENTDPRIQTVAGVENAKGAEFLVAKLKSGLWLCGPSAGYDFSMVKPKIDELFTYEGLDEGSQFRSRDLYARVAAHLMDAMEDELDFTETTANKIPELRGYYICHIDNFGNIKTTITHNDFKGKFEYGDTVKIKIGSVEQKAKYVSNLFGGTPGELVIYPGSSGHRDNPLLEVSIWRHFTEANPTTGIHIFNQPRPGMTVQIQK